MNYLSWIGVSIVVYAVGDYASKKFAIHPSAMWGSVAIAAYAAAGGVWLLALTERNLLSIVGPIWSVASFIVTVLIGIFVFGESLSLMVALGVMLGAASIVIMSLA